jgi:acyl CoA:acetate/3-ketoacid CoA transferase beta subunit
MIITEMAVFSRDNRSGNFRLIELAPGVDRAEVRMATEAHYEE